MADRITYVGLDVHKESIVVAVAAGGLRGEVREYGRITNTATALDRLLRKLGGDGITLRFCYEAGPCGYGIQRRLSSGGRLAMLHRVTGGGRPPPVPTERSVQISRTTLFRR
jgi:transposase